MRKFATVRPKLVAAISTCALFVHLTLAAQTINGLATPPIKTFPPTVLPNSCGSPPYPNTPDGPKTEGKYSAQFDVASDGTVLGIKIYQTTGNASVDDASLAAIRTCRFAPGTAEGKPVRATALVEIAWKGEKQPSMSFIDIYARWRGQ